jgi:hypothetical protein
MYWQELNILFLLHYPDQQMHYIYIYIYIYITQVLLRVSNHPHHHHHHQYLILYSTCRLYIVMNFRISIYQFFTWSVLLSGVFTPKRSVCIPQKKLLSFVFSSSQYSSVNKWHLLTFRICSDTLQFRIVYFSPVVMKILAANRLEVTGE